MFSSKYRPESFLSIISKLFDVTINNKVLEYIETNKVINDEPYGFPQYHQQAVWVNMVPEYLEKNKFISDV